MAPSMALILVLSAISIILAFLFTAYLYRWVKKQRCDNAEIKRVAAFIQKGANTFMRKEYIILAKFAGVAAILIFIFLPKSL